MQQAGRMSDNAHCSADIHGCPACGHVVTGPLLDGSTDVIINARGAARVGDTGVHSSCCGPNRWIAVEGAERVLINGRPAHRNGDATRHCGGTGTLVMGSSNVLIGGPAGTGVASGLDSDHTTPRYKIRVRLVFRDTNAPLADEPYELLDEQENVVRSGRTDAEGRLEERDLKPGAYSLRVENDWILRL